MDLVYTSSSIDPVVTRHSSACLVYLVDIFARVSRIVLHYSQAVTKAGTNFFLSYNKMTDPPY